MSSYFYVYLTYTASFSRVRNGVSHNPQILETYGFQILSVFYISHSSAGRLNVDGISDIIWENTFDNLVLPNQVKDLLLAFAKSKTRGDVLFDDFVGGKGKGIIMLLSGPPGVGKTLTAEAGEF
jgi:ATP-dependent Lon protease